MSKDEPDLQIIDRRMIANDTHKLIEDAVQRLYGDEVKVRCEHSTTRKDAVDVFIMHPMPPRPVTFTIELGIAIVEDLSATPPERLPYFKTDYDG